MLIQFSTVCRVDHSLQLMFNQFLRPSLSGLMIHSTTREYAHLKFPRRCSQVGIIHFVNVSCICCSSFVCFVLFCFACSVLFCFLFVCLFICLLAVWFLFMIYIPFHKSTSMRCFEVVLIVNN